MLRDKFITCSIQKINLISFEVKHIKLRQWQEKGVYKEVSNQVQGQDCIIVRWVVKAKHKYLGKNLLNSLDVMTTFQQAQSIEQPVYVRLPKEANTNNILG